MLAGKEPTAGAASWPLALAVADINWFTTESLFREIDGPGVSLLALRCLDYLNGWRQGASPGHARAGPSHGDAALRRTT